MTIPSFSSYQPPGVFVEDVSTPVVASSFTPSQVVTLIGPALGYRTAVQSLLLSASTAIALTYRGVFTTAVTGPPPVAAPVVTTPAGTVLTPGVDYTLTTTADPSGNPGLATTTIVRVSGSPHVSEGQQVQVVYNYADASYYLPQMFTDPQSVINAYGQPFLSSVPVAANSSQVANPLTAAAQIAFANGATTLLCVPLNPADGSLSAQFNAAYAKVSSNANATLVVPVFTDDLTPQSGTVAALSQSLAQGLGAAMIAAYNNGFPRIGFFGLPRNYSESDIPIPSLSANIGTKRVVLAYPEIELVYNTSAGQTFQASGCYLAVACASVLSSLPVDTGITNQVLKGFVGLPQSEIAAMTTAFMNSLAAAGVTVCYSLSGVLTVRHGLTTDQSNSVNATEISMVRQSDALLTAMAQGIQGSGLIGSPITANTVTAVQEAVLGILEAAVTTSVIIGYTNLSVVQQSYPGGNPTVISVTFQYQPALPLNYITVQMSIDLSNGLVATQSAQNASGTGG